MGYEEIVVLLLLLLCYSEAVLEMTGDTPHTYLLGSDARIPCSFNVKICPVKKFTVLWYHERNSILSSDEPVTDKYLLNNAEVLNGDAGMTVFNISISDAGVYTCSVSCDENYKQVSTDIPVKVQATPKITIVNKVVIKNEKKVLNISIYGFYPMYINITWLRDGEILDNVIVEKPQRLPDGTYGVTSSVTITPTEEDRGRTFSCRVQHESLNQPLQEDFQLVYGARPNMSIHGKTVQKNTENTLTCRVTGFFPRQIEITWLRDGEALSNQSTETAKDNNDGTYQVDANVTITPTDEDQNRTYSCRVQHISLESPMTKDFKLDFEEENPGVTVSVIIVLVTFALFAGLALVVFFCLRRRAPRNHGIERNKRVRDEAELGEPLNR